MSTATDDKPVTEREILARVERMIEHLDRLLMARDISEPDYDAALMDLSQWEEAAMRKARGKAE